MTSPPDIPPFTGYVETTHHALRLIHAARQGYIPRITRRLNDAERRTMIKSGAVFVFSVEESGIKRWTDGLLWSPSRIVGNFLVYREINERSNSRGGSRKPYISLDSQSRGLSQPTPPAGQHVAFKGPGHLTQGDHATFKVGGLIKKTITVNVEGSDLHLISYYTPEDIKSGKLKRPTIRSDIMSLHMPPNLFRFANFRVPPKIEVGPDNKPRLVPEPEDETLSHIECKIEEEPSYNLSSITDWTSEDLEAHTDRLHQACYAASPPAYSVIRSNTNQGWSSPSPSPTYAHSLVRRRETGCGDSWSTTHSQSNRWRSDSYTTSGSNAERYKERATSSIFQGSGNRDILSHRVSWSHRDDHSGHGGERYSVRSPQIGCHTPSLSPGQNYPKSLHGIPTWQSTHGASDALGTYSVPSQESYETPYSSSNDFSAALNYRYT